MREKCEREGGRDGGVREKCEREREEETEE